MKKLALSIIVLLSSAFCMFSSIAAEVKTAPTAVAPVEVAVTEPTQPPTAEQDSGRIWNLQDADIISVINEVANETGKNFVIDPRVNGKITLISSKPIKKGDVYDVFLSILGLLGYSAIPSGDVIKIVPNMESGEMATRVATSVTPGNGDEVVVRVIPIEHVSATQLIPIIRPMLPQWSNISVYTPGNVIIIIGRANNMNRILDVVRAIDKSSTNDIDVVSLRQSSASQMATVLSNLQNAGRATGETPQVSIAADERSNSILLGGNKAARSHMRELIAELDAPSRSAQGNTDVIYLRYQQAKTLAPILGKIAQNILSSSNNPAVAPPTGSSTPAGTKNKDIPENLTSIQAEPSTNAIIITAPPVLMKSLKAIVEKLDIRPAQVLIEGIIVEIDQEDLKNLGIQWGALISDGTILPPANSGFQPFGEGTMGIIPGQQIQAVLSILQNTTNANVLATPSVVVLDNHQALLEVGQDVPIQTGSYATTGNATTATPFNTTGYKQVVLGLQVTPQINLGSSVRLGIKLRNDTLQNPSNPGLTPLINVSRINNSVIVNSCDILVIGGLIRNNISSSVDKVPLLGDIPIVGTAFKHNTQRLEKKNLVVFIKPIILHTGAESNEITHTKYDLTRNAQINWPVDLSEPGQQKLENILPRWKNNVVLPKPFEDR